MADITLISGSTLGGAEYVAEHLAEKLEAAGFSTETVHGPLLEDLSTSGIWLIISSTHGAGDIPDNLTPFYEGLQAFRRRNPIFPKAFRRRNPIFPRYVSAQLALAVENTTRFVARLRK
ncbi:Flavoprotein MioC [Salmonella enterica subsp. enterica serovar Wandsworth str. A4-580]|uniref:Flavoprotein MioC n=1 Tax=Salmonella enterica subsp. enterica serovar Wandsworth str. A4-580 TaxID=913086 RepID=G5SIW2_SALET|nr:Flavoprotein MioC [Salmonella enterica subsp. enterica serovar Wandsworth str. A4-580]